MRKAIVTAALAVVVLVVGTAPETLSADESEIGIMISPSNVAMRSEGVWVTVHADIPYWSVASATVTLNGIEVEWTKADNRGDLVAKFALDEVKEILEKPSSTLTLSGVTKDGTSFTGTDTISVK